MSDKSFGDHTNRNIVKNPLLSTAVTGLSLEDLTHKAVLLPVTPSLDQIIRSDQQQGSQATTLAHSKHESSTFPCGDAFSNISLSNTPQITKQNILDNKKNVNLEENSKTQSVTQPKGSAKTDDDFDVNEYIARLQGSRYVSAPLHSHLKEDQNVNLEATEENLEEINLNETVPAETQQSLTADIAQNFSQLPTVLPHVASAVFSSFSNMLSYKSREQTPDQRVVDQGSKSGYDEVQFQRPDLGVEEIKAPKEVAPPPKELPIGGTGNFRITSKKKYAQIPGLSTGDAAQAMTYPPVQNTSPFGQNLPPVGLNMPPVGQHFPPVGQNMPPVGQQMPPVGQNMPPVCLNMPPAGQHMPPVGQNMPPAGQTVPSMGHNIPHVGQNMPSVGFNMPHVGQTMPPIGQYIPQATQNAPLPQASFAQYSQHDQNMSAFDQSIPSTAQNMPFASQSMSNIGYNMTPVEQSGTHFVQPPVGQKISYLDPNKVEEKPRHGEETKIQEGTANTQPVAEKQSMINIFNPATENNNENKHAQSTGESQPNLLTGSQNFFTPVEQNIPPTPGTAAIIPPPPMFSNLPKRDSQSSAGKSVLPPSVARRISANQPIIKPAVSAPSFMENIFVPAPVQDGTESGKPDNNFSSGNSSAFVPAFNSSFKSEQIGSPNIPLSSQNLSSSIPPPIGSAAPATYFVPSTEMKPPASNEPSTFFTPKEPTSAANISLSVSMMASPNLPPVMPTSTFPSAFGPTAPNLPPSSLASMNMPKSSIFTSGNINKPENVSPSVFQPPPQNVPPPMFFNPQQVESPSHNAPHPITQMPPMAAPEPPKPVPEPPKATGNVNFRMTKKRPQYYAGPIEGVGAISNNVKPVIAPVLPCSNPVETSNFQGALFTPEQPLQPAVEQYAPTNIEQASVPFDISKPVEQASSHAAFDISKPQEYSYGTSFDMRHTESQNYEHEYNTPFDMSRGHTDLYNEPKQESKGFGIIGSLKSKLSSIDINKIQSTVTTFFDPAYNDTKVDEPIQHDNVPYQQQQYGQMAQEQSSFDIFVPNVEQSQYNQFAQRSDYSHTSQYLQTPQPHWQSQSQSQNVTSYSTSSYFTDPNYSTEQVYSQNPLYDNTQTNQVASSYPLEASYMTSETDVIPFHDPNTLTHENVTKSPTQHPSYDNSYQNKHQVESVNTQEIHRHNVNPDHNAATNIESPTSSLSQLNTGQQKSSIVAGSEEASNMTYCNPDSFAQENRQIWEPQQDNFASFSQAFDQHQNVISAAISQKQEPEFYNPNAFAFENQQISKSHQQIFGRTHDSSDNQKDFVSNVCKTMSGTQIDSQPSCDLALNTSKYNMANTESNVVKQKVSTIAPLLPAASFFDSPLSTNISLYPKDNENDFKSSHTMITDVKTEELRKAQYDSKYSEISKILPGIPALIGTKNQENITKAGGDNKYINFEQEQQGKDGSLIESLSKDDIPVLGVSTAPLFGLSTIIADKSKEVSELESRLSFNIHQTKSLFEENTASSFFENKEPENKIISENQVKKIPLDITALSIDDVKNVLVIEPPQENISSLLKRNASSSILENLPEKTPEHHKQQSDDITKTTFQEGLKILDESTPDLFFKHPKEIEERDSQGVAVHDEHSELNICETCREVNTPEHESKHKESEDLTTQLIENITSKLQLSHPLTVPLKESDPIFAERSPFVDQQLDEITQVAEETFETLQVQSATELLDKRTTSEVRDYGWTTEEIVQPAALQEDHDYASKFGPNALVTTHDLSQESNAVTASILAQEYDFKLDPNSIGFFGNNSLFFDNLPVPTNASDEIKAEIKHSHEDIILPRQMSIPTAPPEEDVLKLDEAGVIDVHSIEQDAKKDFPLEEEFIIEPSTDDFLSTDDDKIEFRERKRSSEDSTTNDTFTNRIERFKKKNDNADDDAFEQKPYSSPPISMASYFDTGNYAVESHFRNSLVTMRIPPGFEEEYARKLSGVSLGSAENTSEPYIPDTSTQTRPISTPTYSSPYDAKENIIGAEMRRKENAEIVAQAFVESKTEITTLQTTEHPAPVTEQIVTEITSATDTTSHSNTLAQNVQPLTNPINFFSSNVDEPKLAEPASAESFNRLASYFSMPPAQPEPSKSFFELSQSQNHYRHEPKTQNNQKPFFELSQSQNHYIDDDTKNNIKELMKDLTSPQNIIEHTVKTVNYFTVELDNDIHRKTNIEPINIKLDDLNINKTVDIENNETKPVKNCSKDKDCDDILKCEYCRRYICGIHSKVFIVKTGVNEQAQPNNETKMPAQNDNNKVKMGNIVNFNFDVEKQPENSVTVTLEHRAASDYTPVKHHWFYRVDVEEKSVWRGFSNTDSTALEEAYHSPDLNENTLVPTDGGRYDVNVVGRLRIAVYWKEKPTNVRRCSWFYKGTTDARYVPYTEPVAEKLEEEYRHGVTTGEWHRKLVLPNSEMVIMHGPSVMVHFLHSTSTDAFSTPPNLLGKRIYRNPPKIKVERDQDPKIDHLILLVHGAGEYKSLRFLDQAAARPRVVRRSHEESEIEESEPSKIDHLLLLCHGVGSACDMRFRSVEEVVEDFRTTSLQLLQSHYRNSYDNGLVSRVEVLPISWHEQLHGGEAGVDRRLARVTLDSIPRLRAFTNHTVLDVLFYTSPVFHQTIIDTVCSEMNRVYSMFRERNPHFTGEVSLGGHSLGSVILYDLLCHQSPESPLSRSPPEARHVTGASSTGQPVNYPQLCFPPAALYALGSPIAIFECIRGVDSLGMDFVLPTCKNFFNIFHPYDPIAYRIEPLINPQLQEVKPSQIPHHKGRKRMHLELKDTMARVGADLKQKLIESLRTTWNKWKATPPPEGQLEKVVEEEIEKEQLTNEEEPASEMQATSEMLGRLNGGRRVDYVLQEAPLEMINEYLFAMSSHVGYWESEDTMLLMLREIYDSLGVQPDSTVPQQSMTMERSKAVPQDESSKLLNEPDIPSTSRGST